MIRTENDLLAEEYRDNELWRDDIPAGLSNEACSKCGEALKHNQISFPIDNSSGIHWYAYHKKCLTNALDNVSNVNDKRNLKSKPNFNALKG